MDLVPLTGKSAETVQDDLRRTLAAFPGVNFAIRGFLAERIEETLTGSTAELVVRVYGDDLDSLDVAARRVAEMLGRIPGAIDVQYDPPPVAPDVTVRLRLDELPLYGLRPDEVLGDARDRDPRAARRPDLRGQPRHRCGRDLVARAPRAGRRISSGCPSPPSSGRQVELGQIADIARTTGRSVIAHVGARRVQTVTANVRGRDPESVTRDLEAALGRASVLPTASTRRSAARAPRSGRRAASCCATACSRRRAS